MYAEGASAKKHVNNLDYGLSHFDNIRIRHYGCGITSSASVAVIPMRGQMLWSKGLCWSVDHRNIIEKIIENNETTSRSARTIISSFIGGKIQCGN